MTILLDDGWAEWDWQLGTFRAQINNNITGKYTGDINTVEELAIRIFPTILTAEQILELNKEKQNMQSYTINKEGIL